LIFALLVLVLAALGPEVDILPQTLPAVAVAVLGPVEVQGAALMSIPEEG
jgi:hypothetical protein